MAFDGFAFTLKCLQLASIKPSFALVAVAAKFLPPPMPPPDPPSGVGDWNVAAETVSVEKLPKLQVASFCSNFL